MSGTTALKRISVEWFDEAGVPRGSQVEASRLADESFGFLWSSYEGRMGDVSVSEGDEGRGSLR